jgi:hypothetical protein
MADQSPPRSGGPGANSAGAHGRHPDPEHEARERQDRTVDIPDLEPVPSRSSVASSQTRTKSAQPALTKFEFDASLEEPWISGLGSGLLELDVPEQPKHDGSPAGSTDQRRWPTATKPAPDSTKFDPAQLRQLCPWREPPSAWWQNPYYAIAVYRGQRELIRDREAISVELRQVESRRESYLADLAVQLRDRLEGNARFDSALKAVRTAEAALEQCHEQLQHAESSSTGELDAIDSALQSSNTQLNELQASVSTTQTALANAELNLHREQARVQRLGIERRNLDQSQLSEDQKRDRLAELSQKAASLMPAVDTCQLAVQSQRAQRTQIETQVAQKQSEMDNLRLRRAAVERELAARLDSAGTALAKANSERAAALADLGRGILLTRNQVPIDERHVTELLRFDDAVAALFQREQLYAAAMANYDRNAVKRGIQLTGLVVLLLVVWCAWRIFA